ncbi:unnamed protein product [Adineta ricciae]|uniref:Uncharacterized protein n=1 Tax=Adineta ricciae TaxID=249248 RepID=A0A815LGU9_ADIRI|nr:unnamed protein product [Adineta ricciae]CAF1633369.1 unnamed protein product [Adineta ricciae]
MQNTTLIWLDNYMNTNLSTYRLLTKQIQSIVNNSHIFADNDECIELVLNNNCHKVYLITSGSIGHYLVPCIHDIPQLDCLFIFCENKLYHEQWAKDWMKIKGVFIDIVSLCKSVEGMLHRYEQITMPISFIVPERGLDQLEPSFMYTQLFKEIFLFIDFEDQHILEFIKYHPGLLTIDGKQSNNVERLVRDYHGKKPIWWYTRGTALHSMLNCALRTMNGDILVRMGFFIVDLHRNIKQLHKEQFIDRPCSIIFTVFRGQGLSQADFEELKKSEGGLMSFNNFLSTSTKRDVCLSYAESSADSSDLLGVLFNIEVDPSQSTTPFAFISSDSQFSNEAEVLFSMHSVFRIHDSKSIGIGQSLYEVNLSLTNDSDKDLITLTDHIREETCFDKKDWLRLGDLLIKLDQNEKADEICKMLSY